MPPSRHVPVEEAVPGGTFAPPCPVVYGLGMRPGWGHMRGGGDHGDARIVKWVAVGIQRGKPALPPPTGHCTLVK